MYFGCIYTEDEFFSLSVTCKQESLFSDILRQTTPSASPKNIFYWKMALSGHLHPLASRYPSH